MNTQLEFEEAKSYDNKVTPKFLKERLEKHLKNVEWFRKEFGYKIGEISAGVAYATFEASAYEKLNDRTIPLNVEIKYAKILENKLYETGTHDSAQRASFLQESMQLIRAAWNNYEVSEGR